MSMRTEQSQLPEPGAASSPSGQPEFEIYASCNSIRSNDFEITIRTQASREDIYEAMRTKYVPIALDNIEPIEGGFVLHFPDHISSRFAGDFFHAYWAGTLAGKPDPLSHALTRMGCQSISEVEGILDPQFYSDLIHRYYDKIDKGDVEWVIAMFAPAAIYERADAKLDGHDAIAEFYRSGRKITGTHLIDEPIVSGDTVIVRGVFDGKGADGSSKHVRFSDIWRFEGRLVVSRQTYLALGSSYVKE